MERLERFYKIEQLLNSHKVVPLGTFLDRLGVSRATFKRDLEYLRSAFSAPIEWDKELNGYRWGRPNPNAPKFQLPGLWFNPQEIHALLTMQHLLNELEPGLLAPHIAPLQKRLAETLEAGDAASDAVQKRVRILHFARRARELPHFGVIARAVLTRKRLELVYYTREKDETTRREVSPQRLVHYRDNWYLDAWCHLRDGLRIFAMDAIREATPLDSKAKPVPESDLDEEVAAAYGIFSGKPKATAKLRFTAKRARWVANEQWHPRQKGSLEADGRYVLEVPYSDDRELIMDILKHGAEVEVLGPPELRERMRKAVVELSGLYR